MKHFIIISLLIVANTLVAQSNIVLNADFSSNNKVEVESTLEDFGSIFQISKMLGVDTKEILAYNNISSSASIEAKDKIKVPISGSQISNKAINDGKGYVLQINHKVNAGETAYRIAKTILNQDVKGFLKRNDVSESGFKPGVNLVLGYINVAGNEIVVKIDADEKDENVEEEKEMPEVIWVKQKGIAYVNKNSKSSGKFVLHPHARINSEISIYSPQLKRTVRAKVVGRIPDGTYMNDAGIVMSASTAKSLGALDGRFMVEMTYIDYEATQQAITAMSK